MKCLAVDHRLRGGDGERSKDRRACNRLVLLLTASLGSNFLWRNERESNKTNIYNTAHDYAKCEGCFCIPEKGERCPSERQPPIDFEEMLPKLRLMEWLNPVTLDCDPYQDDECDLLPSSPTTARHPVSLSSSEELHDESTASGACIVEFFQSSAANSTSDHKTQEQDHQQEDPEYSYYLRTYAGPYENAVIEGLTVTHAGPCGACSSLQDLAVYMEQGANLRHVSATCGIRGAMSSHDGMRCFRELGFTEACSSISYYNTRNTQKFCKHTCFPFVLFGGQPNQAAGDCHMATCLQCDEDYSGPIFKKVAGRTRRNSGLMSGIARPCSELIPLEQQDPFVAAARSIAKPALLPQVPRRLLVVVENNETTLLDQSFHTNNNNNSPVAHRLHDQQVNYPTMTTTNLTTTTRGIVPGVYRWIFPAQSVLLNALAGMIMSS